MLDDYITTIMEMVLQTRNTGTKSGWSEASHRGSPFRDKM